MIKEDRIDTKGVGFKMALSSTGIKVFLKDFKYNEMI